MPDTGLKGHAVIVGGGRVGGRIAASLERFALPFVVIEADHRRFRALKGDGVPAVYGDASREAVLGAAQVENARLLVVTTNYMVAAQLVIRLARSRNAAVNIVVRTSDAEFLPVLRKLEVGDVVLPEFEAGLEMARRSLLGLGVSEADVQANADEMRQAMVRF